MAGIEIRLDHAGMAELLRSPAVQRECRTVAERVAARARAIAPVETGEYRDSIGVEDVPDMSRARSRVVATSEHALVVEARHRVLGRALDGD